MLSERRPKQILLVTGKASYAISGAEDAIATVLSAYRHVRFSDFGSNLQLSEVLNGVSVFNQHDCDLVVGIGGGSVIDMAKAAALLGPQPGNLTYDTGLHFLAGVPPSVASAPTIIIPTTAGTGSESTHFSVIYVEHTKHSLTHESMLPSIAILDPDLTDSMPPDITACTGLDALCQAVESFWSVQSTETSRDLSRQAIKICVANLVLAVNRPTVSVNLPTVSVNLPTVSVTQPPASVTQPPASVNRPPVAVTQPMASVRDRMVQAANLSGQAIALARTTAAHAASYPLSARYGIPHGHAVALFLPFMFYHNCVARDDLITDSRGAAFVSERMNELLELMPVDSPRAARDWLINLIATVGLETRLSQLGVKASAISMLAEECCASDRARNNPSVVTRADVQTMLETML
jgi:alcohol dehydrogenase class IV